MNEAFQICTTSAGKYNGRRGRDGEIEMYGKIFTQIYEGTLASKGPWEALVTFQQFIVLANKHGEVDMTPDAISRRTTIPLDVIQTGIEALEKPDPDSRTPKEEGRRIVRLCESRSWGWRITNYEQYRTLRSEEERREYQARWIADKRSRTAAAIVDNSRLSTVVDNVDLGSKQYAVKTISSEVGPSDPQVAEPKPLKEPSPEARDVAKLLRARITENNLKAKITDAQERKWATEADRMIRRDGRTPAEIREVIEFAQADSFWRANVLSMEKLRKQFAQLWGKSHAAVTKPAVLDHPGPTPPQRLPRPELNDAGRKIYEQAGVSV